MSPAKAMRRALSRTADVLWDLALVTHGVEIERLDQDGVTALLPPGDLLVLLDGPDGALGLAAVSREVMTGLTEVQTILQVTQMPVEDRPLTQTDAAMTAPLLDGALERFARYLDGHPVEPQFEGFRFGAMVEDARAASLLLDAPGYRVFRVSVDLALGRRKGELLFVFPDRPDAVSAAHASEARGNAGPHEKKMTLLPVRMDAVLCRVSLPLQAAQALKPGDLIPLPGEVLDGLTLHAGAGDAIAGGRLGQMNGMRAVRLNWPEGTPQDEPAGDFAAPPAEPPAMFDAPAPVPEAEETPPPAEEEELPDLPPMEFDTGDFDTGDFGFDAAPADGSDEESGEMDFDFAAAPLDTDEG